MINRTRVKIAHALRNAARRIDPPSNGHLTGLFFGDGPKTVTFKQRCERLWDMSPEETDTGHWPHPPQRNWDGSIG